MAKTTVQGSVNVALGAGKTVDLGEGGVSWIKLDGTTGITHYRLTEDSGSAPTDPVAVLVAAATAATANAFLMAVGGSRTHGIPGDASPGGPRWRYLEVWGVAAAQLAYQAGN